MKRKINILITASLLALLALSAIQYYLILNTYELQKELFKKEAKQKLSFIETDVRDDVWDDAYLKKSRQLINSYKRRPTSKEKLLTELLQFRDSINQVFNTHFNNEIEKRNLPFKVAYQQVVKSMVLLDSVQNDTLFNNPKEPFLLFGKSLDKKNRWHLNTGRWESSTTIQNDTTGVIETDESVNLEIRTISYVGVPNWRGQVFKRMWWILALAGLSIATVIGLFVYAITSFIKQKKNADIKTDFINNITHELKTPLATLSIATKTLQQPEIQNNKDALQTTINTVDRQRTRLQKLIDQVVHNSQGYEAIKLNKETIIDQHWLQPLVDDFQLTKNNITIKTRYPVKKVPLVIDKFHLSSALLNVLDNAVKYGGTNIGINATQTQNQYSIAITDNGIGIDNKHKTQILDKFYRVNNTDIHNVKGLGLGLYYVNQIVKAHNGELQIESQPEQGTTVTLQIPL